MADIKNMNWIVPSSIDLEKLLKENPPDFKYKLDHFYFIIDYLSSASDLEDLDNNEGYINMNAATLQSYNHNYKKYVDHLIETHVILSDGKFVKGKKSKGYILNSREVESSTIKYVPIKDFVLRKKIKSAYLEVQKSQKGLKGYSHLTKWFNGNLKIDAKSALEKVEELFPIPTGPIRGKKKGKPSRTSRRYKAFVAIDKIQRGDLYYNVDKNVGRFHSNLTNIKKELREFVTYGDKKIVNIDIKNCQPLLSTLLLKSAFWKKSKVINFYQFPELYNLLGTTPAKYNKTIQDILLYIMLVENPKTQAGKGFYEYIKLVNSGDFYRGISKTIAPNAVYDKDKMKVMMFMVFFSSNRFIGQVKAIPKKLFKIKFPDVYKVFQLIKKNNHATLPIMLQKIESQIIVERATKRIGMERPNLPIFTIHDSIATIQGEEDYVEKVLKESIFEYTGLSAKIGKEFWG
jgi:hypothetical protein